MKDTMNRLIGFLFFFSIIFAGCSDLSSPSSSKEKAEGFVVSGTVSFGTNGAAPSAFFAQNSSARTAVPSFSGLEYTITATPSDGGDSITAKSNPETGTFLLKIPSEGYYNIKAEYADSGIKLSAEKDSEYLTDSTKSLALYASPMVTYDPSSPDSVSPENGSIKLRISNYSSSVKKATVWLEAQGTALSKEINFSAADSYEKFFEVEGGTLIGRNSDGIDVSLTYGNYTAIFEFRDENDEVVYYCTENILVYPGFVTDTWYGDGAHISYGSFVITDELTGNYGKKLTNYVLWNNSSAENKAFYDGSAWSHDSENSGLTVGMQLFSELNEGQSISSPFPETTLNGVQDFCFDENGNLYVLSGGTVYKYRNCFGKYSSAAVGYENIDNALSNMNIGGAPIIDIQYSNGVLWVIFNSRDPDGDVSSTETFNYIAAILSNFDEVGLNTSFTAYTAIASGPIDDTIDCFVVDDGYAYIARNYTTMIEKDGVKQEVQCYNVSKSVLALNEDKPGVGPYSIILNQEGDKNDADITPSDALDITNPGKISVNDMQIVGGNLYVLISTELGAASRTGDSTNPSFYCKGGVVKIPLDSFGTAPACEDWADFANPKVLGWWNEAETQVPIEDSSYYFYCPRKFIARRTNELVIADDGIYNEWDGESLAESTNMNRVVTINLDNPSTDIEFTTVGVMFSGQADSSGYLE